MWRAVAAGISVVVAAASGVVTALVTTHPSRGLWVALGIAVIVGAVLQAAVTYGERQRRRRVDASGAGAGGDWWIGPREHPHSGSWEVCADGSVR
jgi:hypothetical protein